jgi:hypothetical protein
LKLNLHDKLPLLDAIVEILNKTTNIDPGDRIELEKFVSSFCANVSRRWQKAGRSSKKFLAKNSAWLELKVQLLVPPAAFGKNADSNYLDFGSCSRATKQRRIQHLKNEDLAILANFIL